MTIVNLQKISNEENETGVQSIANAIAHPNPVTQLLLASKLLLHRPEAGLNPLVDAAAAIFSMMGKLKHMKSCRHLGELHDELVQEIETYKETVQSYHYTEQYISEYIPITCYALCATLDDVIASTPWGAQGKWDDHSMVVAFNQEPLSQKSFFIILERLVRDPAIYIDVMEFMYICLSLGFKCCYNADVNEFNHEQLEQITNALYKRIRAYRGNFSKTLSPFSIRPTPPKETGLKKASWLTMAVAGGLLMVFFVVGKYVLDRTFNQTYQNLTQMDKTSPYEIRH